jgi:hypothetical protein
MHHKILILHHTIFYSASHDTHSSSHDTHNSSHDTYNSSHDIQKIYYVIPIMVESGVKHHNPNPCFRSFKSVIIQNLTPAAHYVT